MILLQLDVFIVACCVGGLKCTCVLRGSWHIPPEAKIFPAKEKWTNYSNEDGHRVRDLLPCATTVHKL